MPKFINQTKMPVAIRAGFIAVILLQFSLHTVSAQQSLMMHPSRLQPSAQDEHVFTLQSTQSKIKIVERSSRIIELPEKMLLVDRYDGEVITITALTPYRVRVQAKKPGITSMVITNEFNKEYQIEVFC